MSFDAGSITGGIGLDISAFTGGILQSQALASTFPGIVNTFLVDPLLGVVQSAKAAASAIVDAFTSIGHAADNAGESAEKAGVSVEFLTGIGAAFKDAGSSVEGLGDSLKFLNRNAAEAAEGNEQAVKSFANLGISADYLKSHLGDTEGNFFAVADAIAALPTPAEKTRAAMELLGRGGSDAIAALNKGSGGLKSFAADITALGGTIDTDLANAGDKFGSLDVMVDAAWEGIKKTVAQPILAYVAAHFDEIKGALLSASQEIRSALGGVGDGVASMIPGLIQFGGAILTNVVDAFKTWGPFIGSAVSLVGSLASLVGSVLTPVLKLLQPVIEVISAALTALANAIKDVVSGLAEFIGAAGDAVGLSGTTNAASGAGGGQGGTATGTSGGTTIQKVEVKVDVNADDAHGEVLRKIDAGLRDTMGRVKSDLAQGKARYVYEGL